jgi:hypothetical protein
LSEVRTEFQRTLVEPAAVSRRAATWWPASISLEKVMDTLTATAVRSDADGSRPPAPESRQVADALRDMAQSIRAGRPLPPLHLPDHKSLAEVSEAVRSLHRTLSSERGESTADGTGQAP